MRLPFGDRRYSFCSRGKVAGAEAGLGLVDRNLFVALQALQGSLPFVSACHSEV